MGEKFISVNTRYGRKGDPMAPPHKVEGKRVGPDETVMGEAGGEILPIKEYYARAADVKPVVRKGEQLTKSDKDELAILRQQIEEVENKGTGMGRQFEASSASRINLTGEEVKWTREGIAAYNDLKEKIDNARFEAEQSYGDAEAAQRVRDLEEQLANLKQRETANIGPSVESEDAGKTMIVKPLEFKKPGFLAKLFGRKQK